MIVGIPFVIPVTTPEPEPIVAWAGLLLLHTPFEEVSLKVIEDPRHTLPGPVMGAGEGFTVTVVVFTQPAGDMYLIETAPGVIPVTFPEVSIVAIEVSRLTHVPPAAESVRIVAKP